MRPSIEVNPHWAEMPQRMFAEKRYGKGLLPRSESRTRFVGPRFQERIDVIPESEWSKFIGGEGFVKQFVHRILDQNQVGSCASEATAQCTMIVRAVAGLEPIVLSPWSLYQYVNGGQDRGSTLDDNVNASMKIGILPMDDWGRDKGWQAKVPASLKPKAKRYRITEWFEIKSKVEFGTAIIKRFSVFYGRDAHAITAAELVDDGVIYVNSWGDWVDQGQNLPVGFGFDPWSKLIQAINSYGCFAARTPVIPSDEALAI